MASLSSALSSAVQSLGADTSALEVTNSNIANANTPGYSRQVPVFQEAAPTEEGNLSVGNGVVLEGFQSVRDQLVTSQIQQETQAQGSANTNARDDGREMDQARMNAFRSGDAIEVST